MIEIERATHRHSIVRRQLHFSCKAANGSRRRYDYDFVEAIYNLVSSENQNRATLVRESKGVPTNLAAFHATFSQPSASQARGSSSLENSDAVGGYDL